MKIAWKRLIAAAAALVMCLSALPVPVWTVEAHAEGSWGEVTDDSVKVRKRAGTDEEYWFTVDMGYTCEVTDVVPADGITWYKVVAEHPDAGSARTYVGYIHGDFIRLLTAEEVKELEDAAAAMKPNTAAPDGTVGEITSSGVNFRETAGGNALFKLDAGTRVEIVTIPAMVDDEHWYQVRYDGYLGFIQSPYVKIVSSGTSGGTESVATPTIYVKLILTSANLRLSPAGSVGAQWENQGEILAVTGTVESKGGYQWYPVTVDGKKYYVRSDTVQVITPAATVTPTPTPTATPEPAKILYVKLILSSANLRLTPGGTVGAQWEKPGEMLLVTGNVVEKGGYKWYPVTYNSFPYFVRSDTVQVIETTETIAPPAATETATPTPTPAATTLYVQLVLSSANLRLSPGGTIAAQWEKTGEILAVTGAPVRKGEYIWYPVKYNNTDYFVRNDTVQEVNVSGAPVLPSDQPTAPETTGAVVGYVKTILDNVNLRLKPAGMVIEEVALGRVLPMLKEAEEADGYAWYYVQVDDVKGYLRGDCVQVVNQDGSPLATEAPTGGSGVASAYGYVRLVEDKVNLRRTIAGKSLMQLDMGTVLPMTGYATQSGSYIWYPVVYNKTAGYVRGDCVIPCDQNGSAIATSQPTATPGPSVSKYGYVKITVPDVNVRNKAAGLTLGTVDEGTVWPMTGEAETKNGYTWYPIDAGDLKGYVRGDCSFKLSAAQQESYLAGNGVPDEPEQDKEEPQVNYIITVLDSVNLREAATKDSRALYNVALGTVMAYNDFKTVGGKIWYRAVYNNSHVWVLGSCVKVMTAKEYEDYLATNPAATPQPEVVKGYVITTSGGINLRNEANGSKILGRVDKGVVMAYVDDPVTERGVAWYHVKHPTLGLGYIHGDYVDQCDYKGEPLPTTGPVIGGGNEGKEEASYTTLRKGSVGDAVKKLVTELKKQGYYTGDITNEYTSAVQEAVTAFQQAKGLTVDGIAGAETQHALFNTVPIGTATGDLTMELHPAEKIDWFTGGIAQLWAKGESFKVYDVYTGIVWWARRWSGGKHLDAEPLTAADTARLCKIYGVENSQQIEDLDLWENRPSLVTIDGHTYACSLYGVPHNYPDGDTIPNNDFKGQLCIHFTNSKGHESGVISVTHQKAIEYAWKNCPAGTLPYNK